MPKASSQAALAAGTAGIGTYKQGLFHPSHGTNDPGQTATDDEAAYKQTLHISLARRRDSQSGAPGKPFDPSPFSAAPRLLLRHISAELSHHVRVGVWRYFLSLNLRIVACSKAADCVRPQHRRQRQPDQEGHITIHFLRCTNRGGYAFASLCVASNPGTLGSGMCHTNWLCAANSPALPLSPTSTAVFVTQTPQMQVCYHYLIPHVVLQVGGRESQEMPPKGLVARLAAARELASSPPSSKKLTGHRVTLPGGALIGRAWS